jgi:hypothetical protein
MSNTYSHWSFPITGGARALFVNFQWCTILTFGIARVAFFYSELLAPGRLIWTLASDTSATVGWESNQTSAVRFKVREQKLRACCEPLREGCVQHSNISRSPPPSCCDHVATILRPCCMQHPTSGAFPPSSTQKPTSHVCKHRNSTSATLKFNICNTQQYASTTSKLDICNIEINACNIEKFISNIETFARDTWNISRTQMQHVYNDLQT